MGGGLQGIWNEELNYSAEMRQGVSLMEQLVLDVVGNFVFPTVLPLLEIIGHKGLSFVSLVTGRRLMVGIVVYKKQVLS